MKYNIKIKFNYIWPTSVFFAVILFFCTNYFINFSSAQNTDSSDAIAIRVIPNANHYSALRWYTNKKFSGSPQALTVDGYEAVRDGRSVYVNAANVSNGNIYTNIYLISFNQEAESATVDIFSNILSHWKFNTNITGTGYCRVGKTICDGDLDCDLDDYCDSQKARLVRDTRRLSDLSEINTYLTSYFDNGYYPKLSSGSYLPGKTLSVWPSWLETLSGELGTGLPVDPVNEILDCANTAGYNERTCWNEQAKRFIRDWPNLPNNSLVYSYYTDTNGNSKNICAVFESGFNISDLNLAAACPKVCLDFDKDGYGINHSPACLHAYMQDCNDIDPNIYSGTAEICNDGLDNDCDGFKDCGDPDCAGNAACSSLPSPCNNNGTCEAGLGETCGNCSHDGCCAASCPNGSCDIAAGECGTCPTDCNNNSACCGPSGDSTCNAGIGECSSCMSDCNANIVSTCCGNGTCDVMTNENYFNCSADCTATCTDHDGDRFISEDINAGSCGSICGPDHNQTCIGNNDCNDTNAAVFPGTAEICDGLDNNCDSQVDEGFTAEVCSYSCMALDPANNYNYSRDAGSKCCGNDANEGHPFQTGEKSPADLCGDGRDNDCDGQTDAADSDCSGICTNTDEHDHVGASSGCNQCNNSKDDDGNQTFPTYPTHESDWGSYINMIDACDPACGPGLSLIDWSHFEPTESTCDGMDNDCDGHIDESLNRNCYTGAAGTQNVGICHGGTQACNAGSWGTCTAEVTPETEICGDNLDNDCDGHIDEGCVCTNGNTRPCGSDVGICQAGTQTCVSNAWGSCNGEISPTTEVCDNLDNDCDGQTDEDLTGPLNTNQNGVCLGSRQSCDGANGWINNYSTVTHNEWPNELTCDNLDNNCNGTVDDNLSRVCYSGAAGTENVGICHGGAQSCSAGSWGACAGQVTPQSAEICTNSLDDDCDGTVNNGCSETCTFPITFPCVFP